MSLRLIEAIIPEAGLDDFPGLLDELRIVDLSTSPADGDTGLVRVLVDAEDSEELTDLLFEEYGSHDRFRLILLSVEATLPLVEKEEEESTDSGEDAEASGNGRYLRRISREELYEDLSQASEFTWVYLVMVALSTIVAAIGLLRDDVALIIGAMVIAPLLGPNVALSLAATLGDVELGIRSLKAIGAGIVIAGAISVLVGAAVDVDPSIPEIAARTHARFGDVILGMAVGTAGSLAFTSGVSGVVVGVMVAVALLPPLVVGGLLVGAGHFSQASGALILLALNVTCVNLAAVATFLLQQVRPRTWWDADRARKATRVAVATWIIMLIILGVLIWLGQVEGTPGVDPNGGGG